MGGKERLLSTGPYPETTLAEARAKRDATRAMLAKRVDPSKAKQLQSARDREQSALTFSGQVRVYLDNVRKERRAEMTMRKLVWLIDMALQRLVIGLSPK